MNHDSREQAFRRIYREQGTTSEGESYQRRHFEIVAYYCGPTLLLFMSLKDSELNVTKEEAFMLLVNGEAAAVRRAVAEADKFVIENDLFTEQERTSRP